jgi:hypothetical protein
MVTAAEGAEAFYTLDNNDSRTETPEEAREMDKRTQGAWVGRPKMYVLDNSPDFEGKLRHLVDFVAKLVGLPTNLSRRTAKLLLRDRPSPNLQFPLDVDYNLFEVEKVYLVTQSTLLFSSFFCSFSYS